MNGKRILLIPAALLLFQGAFAGDPDIKVVPSASIYFQVGQLVNTYDPAQSVPNKTWDQRSDVRLYLNATVKDHLRIIAGAELAMITQVQPPFGNQATGTTTTSSYVVPREGQGIYTFGNDQEYFPLQIALGYFPFKYNPQASNMGEYLFRTGTYPPFIINDFNNCEARLLGLRVSSTLFEKVRADLLFTSETYYSPQGDYSLSILLGYKPNKLIDVGAGVSWSRLITFDPKLTTSGIVYDKDGMTPIIKHGDTLLYTFQGTKLMARCSFDPKQLFPSPNILGLGFGQEDCKLYLETAVLGLQDYGSYYNDLLKRWPSMIGFNVPFFNILDVFAIEMEYCDFNYDKYTFPPGTTPVDGLNSDKWIADSKFHWSLFTKKTVTSGLSISALAGKDHYRNTGSQTPWAGVDNPISSSSNGGELLVGRNDWHYTIRITYSF